MTCVLTLWLVPSHALAVQGAVQARVLDCGIVSKGRDNTMAIFVRSILQVTATALYPPLPALPYAASTADHAGCTHRGLRPAIARDNNSLQTFDSEKIRAGINYFWEIKIITFGRCSFQFAKGI